VFLLLLTLGFAYEYLLGVLQFADRGSNRAQIPKNSPFKSNQKIFSSSAVCNKNPRDYGNPKYTKEYKNYIK
jgi:hypothetical protein